MQKCHQAYWDMETFGTFRFACPLPHTPCLRAEGWGSCRGGYEWWDQRHRWPSMMTRVTSGSSCRLAWLKIKKGHRSFNGRKVLVHCSINLCLTEVSQENSDIQKLFVLCAGYCFLMLISLLLTHNACHTPEGSSRGSALRCPRSCYWYGRRSAHAAECPAHKTRNNGSIQTRETSRPLHSRSLSRREYETEGKKETIKVLFQWGSTPFQPPQPKWWGNAPKVKC